MPRARTRLAVDVLWLLCFWCGVVQWAGIFGATAQVVEERTLWVRTGIQLTFHPGVARQWRFACCAILERLQRWQGHRVICIPDGRKQVGYPDETVKHYLKFEHFVEWESEEILSLSNYRCRPPRGRGTRTAMFRLF
eukprot:1901954-Pyramimonas_sp.AAC.1